MIVPMIRTVCLKWNIIIIIKYIGLKTGLIFLKIWNRFCFIHLENNIKMACYLARIPVDFHFIYLSLSEILCWWPFSLLSFTSTVGLLAPPPVQRHAFPHCFCCYCFFAHFTLHWFDAFCYFFTTCEMSSIKNFTITFVMKHLLNYHETHLHDLM